jgi:hypothetical protein
MAAAPKHCPQALTPSAAPKRRPQVPPPSAAPKRLPPKPLHGMVHHIDTGSAAPVFARPGWTHKNTASSRRNSSPWTKQGIICRSNLPWASTLHLVPKKDGSWRLCGDYHCLNAITIPDRYPLPNMQSLNDSMAGCTVFAKIDLVKAYHQILIAEADIPKTAIATPVGLWEFLFMAFGLRIAAQVIQRLKDNILMGLDYVFSFLDDDGVFSKSRGQHWTHLRTLFAIFSKKLSKTDVN